MGTGAAKAMSATVRTPLGGTAIRLELPNCGAPPLTQVARTRTRPTLAGTFGSTQDPSAATGAVRLSALTMHELSSWADDARAPAAARSTARAAPRQATPPLPARPAACRSLIAACSPGHHLSARRPFELDPPPRSWRRRPLDAAGIDVLLDLLDRR